MSFYDDASLVVIPSGYKTSKVYAEKPTDGSGDLAFTRTGDTATRVNSAGLIEKVRTNLILQSQTFDNASWGKDTTTVTANAQVAPDGTLTADTMTISTDASRVTQSPTIGAGSFTASVYVKIISQTTAGDVRFLGVVDGSVVNVNFTPTNQWARYTATFTASIAITSFQLRGVTGGFVGTIAIWGFQLEAGDVATDYIPTTTAAVSVGPVANVPRLDYLGSTCPRLLLEPQRTNALLQADTISANNWLYVQSTLTSNVTGPDGFSSGRRITNGVTATDPYTEQGITTSVNTFTFSAFVKQGTASQAWLYPVHVGMGSDVSYSRFTFATKTFVNIGNIATSGYQEYENGWYRIFCSVIVTGAVSSLRMRFSNGQFANVYNDWAFPQTEVGSYPTSYIPTLAASATRGADACSKTGISSLIGQTEGTLYWEGSVNGIPIDQTIFGVEKESSNFVIRFGSDGTNLYAQSYNGSANLFYETTTPSVGQTIKLAFAYKAGSYAFFKNGTLVASGSNASTMPACDKLQTNVLWSGSTGIGAYNTNQALLFKTRLTNAQLAELTTL